MPLAIYASLHTVIESDIGAYTGASAKGALALAKPRRVPAPAQLTIASSLGSPNGTAEALLFIQYLEAGGRGNARVS